MDKISAMYGDLGTPGGARFRPLPLPPGDVDPIKKAAEDAALAVARERVAAYHLAALGVSRASIPDRAAGA